MENENVITPAPVEDKETEQLRLFFGKNADYYINKDIELKKKKEPFHLAAFFLGMFWFGYRKMYREVVLLLVIYLVFDAVIAALNVKDVSFGLLFSIIYGLFANYIYIKKAKKTIAKINETISDENARNEAIIKAGGTSIAGVFFSILVFLIYVAILIFIEK